MNGPEIFIYIMTLQLTYTGQHSKCLNITKFSIVRESVNGRSHKTINLSSPKPAKRVSSRCICLECVTN